MKRLYKNEESKMICGVCAGFADYFEIDPTLVRFIWIVLSFINGIGILLYPRRVCDYAKKVGDFF